MIGLGQFWSRDNGTSWDHSDFLRHYNDVIMSTMASQITSLTIVYSTVYSRRSSKKHQSSTAGLCEGNSPVTGEFPAQRASNAENVSIWWRHHGFLLLAWDLARWCTGQEGDGQFFSLSKLAFDRPRLPPFSESLVQLNLPPYQRIKQVSTMVADGLRSSGCHGSNNIG